VAPLVLSVGLAFWLLRSKSLDRSRRWSFAALLATAAICPIWTFVLTASEPFDENWTRTAAQSYERLWLELDASSLDGARSLGRIDLETAERLSVFGILDDLASRSATSLLLIDPAGKVFAWGGEGLLHPLESTILPSTGPAFSSGFAAASVASVRRVGRQTSAWRLVAGRSFSTQRLPFRSPSGGSREDFVWTPIREGGLAPHRATVIEVEGRPSMSIVVAPGSPHPSQPRAVFLLRISWLLIGLILFLSSRSGTRPSSSALPTSIRLWSIVAGIVAVAIAVGTDLVGIVLLTSAATMAGVSARRTGVLSSPRWWPLLPASAIVILTLLAYRLEKISGPVDLGNELSAGPQAAVLRLVAMLIILTGVLPVVSLGEHRRWNAWMWFGGLAATATGLALAGNPVSALTMIALGAVALVGAVRARGPVRSWIDVALVVAIAALIGASTWEVTYRVLVARYLERDVAPMLGPPSAQERSQLDARAQSFFAGTDLLSLAPADPLELDEIDLAYALWRRSPLANSGWLSATAVVIDGSVVSSFEFGVPLDDFGGVDFSPELWQALVVPGWDAALVEGAADLDYLGQPVGRIHYAILPRPGFRLLDRPVDRLASRLVEGSLALRLPIDEVIPPGQFAVFEGRSRAALGPRSAPALASEHLAAPSFSARIDGEWLRGWTHPSNGATEVLFLGSQRPLQTVERMGVQVLGTLILAAAVVLCLLLAGGLSLSTLTGVWQRIYRSYSRKLLLIFGMLLLLTLLMLSIALLGVLGERLGRTQEAAAERAMEAAQHVLGEYVLSLDPGFGVDTALDDALLGWLSRVIQHEVNLYWGSTLYASSNPELFTAGFLPSRLPGEIYSQVALEAASRASRVTYANRERYVELFAPLRIPGIRSQETLFLSIPLLAQQQQTDRSIAELRTRAILVAFALLLAAVGVASRLSHNFTRPLMELIAGTEAIAGGADSIDLQPTELELAALVKAINDMAGKISEARQRLVREKQVVEKMVQNITAGIVSLDSERRILLRNRVAAETLGLEVGESLDEALAGDERFRPLSDFLATAGSEPRQSTLVVHPDKGQEREWSVVWVPMPGDGEPTSLLVVEDVSEVLRGQRLQAWAEMARMIAHEIKNPLTPIRLSTEHMVEVHRTHPEAFEEVFERCSRNILRQVDELHDIASEFSTYSRIPHVQRRQEDLTDAVREVVDSYRAAPPKGIAITLESSAEVCTLPLDRRLFGRALRNLLENALRASADGGEVEVAVRKQPHEIVLTVSDRGPGVNDETLAHMFDPYFSADSDGTGLGLPISRSIIEQHDGTLTAENRSGGGLRATIRLPLDTAKGA